MRGGRHQVVVGQIGFGQLNASGVRGESVSRTYVETSRGDEGGIVKEGFECIKIGLLTCGGYGQCGMSLGMAAELRIGRASGGCGIE